MPLQLGPERQQLWTPERLQPARRVRPDLLRQGRNGPDGREISESTQMTRLSVHPARSREPYAIARALGVREVVLELIDRLSPTAQHQRCPRTNSGFRIERSSH